MVKITRTLFLKRGVLTALLVTASLAAGQGQENKNDKKDSAPPPATACAAKETKPGKEKGPQTRFYEAPLPKVKEALMGALAALEFNAKKDNNNEISAQKSRHMGVFVGSGGETIT